MSQFFAYTQPEYVRKMCKFLGRTHPTVKLLQRERPEGAKGRASNYPFGIIQELENATNETACRCEAYDTTFRERLSIACAYVGLHNAALARQLGVSRQLISGWRSGAYMPKRVDTLAKVLDVPVAWLHYGGEEYLSVHSHLGVRVGKESLLYRENLYGLTLDAIRDVSDDAGVGSMNDFINKALCEDPEMSKISRRSGGRWLVQEGSLVFVPWCPIRAHGLSRRYWSDAVEVVVENALAKHQSVYSAYQEIKQTCEAMGESFPKKITLYKRLANERLRGGAFGMNKEQVEKLQQL